MLKPTAVTAFLFVAGLFASPLSAQTKKKEENVITEGSVVSLEYTLSDEKGQVIESNKGKEPLTYTHGQGQIIPGLEKALTGMKVNEKKNVRVRPEEGYGPVNPKAYQEIPKDRVPAEALKVGTTLQARAPTGESYPVRVHEIKEKTVVLDFNHPLAGKTLTFDVRVLAVKNPASR